MISLYIVKISNKIQNWLKIQKPFKNMFVLDGEVSLLKNWRKLIGAEAHSETSQTSKTKLFAKIVDSLKVYFRKKFNLDVWNIYNIAVLNNSNSDSKHWNSNVAEIQDVTIHFGGLEVSLSLTFSCKEKWVVDTMEEFIQSFYAFEYSGNWTGKGGR